MSESAPDPKPDRFPIDELYDLRDVLLRRWPLVLAIIGGALLVLGIIILIVLLGLRQASPRQATPTITPVTDDTPTPTTISTSPLPTPSCETIISSGDVEVAVSFPVSLTLGDESFPVTPIVRGGEGSLYPGGQSSVATWLCGTVVNYVIGIEPTPENEAALTSLRLGDNIKLQLANGATLSFRFTERKEATFDDPEVLRQQQPRLSLILEKEDTWQVAIADYIAEEEPIEEPASGALAQPGQPTQAGDVQVTVKRGHAERSDELSPGSMYYLVEFSVENTGTEPLGSSNFSMKLQDGNGNVYLLSPRASQAGEYGPLNGDIAPGTVVTGTAGYLVPDPITGPTLTWIFSPSPSSDMQATVGIPHEGGEGGEEKPASERVEVSLIDAFLNNEGDTLIIEGEVRNTGDVPVTIEAKDISLSSSAGIGNLRMAAPPLPWEIQPDQLQVIELQYERPEASAVMLELLGYSFEIEGL